MEFLNLFRGLDVTSAFITFCPGAVWSCRSCSVVLQCRLLLSRFVWRRMEFFNLFSFLIVSSAFIKFSLGILLSLTISFVLYFIFYLNLYGVLEPVK